MQDSMLLRLATVPQHERTKLEPKGTPLIFSIRISRNVTFIETEFPAAKRHICAPTKPTIVHTMVFQPVPIEAPAHPAVPATTSSSLSSAASSIAPSRAPLPTTSASSDTASDSEIDTPCPSPREHVTTAPPAPPLPLSDDSIDELGLIASNDASEPNTMHDAATTNVLLESPPFSDDNDSDDPIALLSQVFQSIADNASLDASQVLAYVASNTLLDTPLDMLPSRDADPTHWHQAMRSTHAEEWRGAAIDEFKSLLNEYNVYTVLDLAALPEGAKLLSSHFVFRTKRDQFGDIKSRKVRLVTNGNTQRPGVDFKERFSPVVCFTSIRALIAIAVLRSYKIHKADINKAYLHGKLDQPLYMRPPQGIDLLGKILKLDQSIYGLKQAGRIWNKEIDATLCSLGYTPMVTDQCVYTKRHGKDWHYIALYVDDLLLIGPSEAEIERLLSKLEDMYGNKRLGDTEYVLGIQLKRGEDGSITLSQERYLQDVLECFDLALAKPATTPMQKNLLLELNESTPTEHKRMRYLQAVGSLMYAALGTRPDLAYAVSYLAQFAKQPGPTHWTAIKHVLRYIRGTVSYGLRYTPTPGPLYGYSDSNWGACVRTSKSTMGYAYFLAGATISWCSKRSSHVADSTTDAKYIALSQSSKEAIHLQQLLEELGIPRTAPTLIYGNNQGANSLTRNPSSFAGTRHIRIREHFVREMVKKRKIKVEYIATANMVLDILTKALEPKLFA
ncbi:BQ2448_2351 [Microbotryum intermedium]|uniref:BQ2448_2351 protein n=1 Tax=Microbotryum intermedium TaxID=269621 RepID=A0A238FB67_9BASI|nr:BQ2448_2351 [Microbotryum intermedium]